MKPFVFINEAEKIDDEITKLIDKYTKGNPLDAKAGNDDIGKANEIFCVFLLNNKKWKGIENLKLLLIEKLKRMGQNAAMDAYNAGKYMSLEFLKEARKMGYGGGIKQSIFSALGATINGQKVNDKINPSDVICQFGWGPTDGWLGMSNKVTTKVSGDIGFKNTGMATLENIFGMKNTKEIIEKYRNDGIKKFKLQSIKDFKGIRDNKDLQEFGIECQNKLQSELLKALTSLSKNKRKFRELVSEYLLNAKLDLFPPYLKVTGRILKNGYSADVDNPIKNQKYLALMTEKFEIKIPGNSRNAVAIYANKYPICQIRFKWESEPLGSSMKTSVEPVSSK